MNPQPRDLLSKISEMVEYLYLRNIAAEQLLEHYNVPDWREILDEYAARQENQPLVRERFSAVRSLLQLAHSDSEALEALLKAFPTRGKPI
jgi:hypothetical protein